MSPFLIGIAGGSGSGKTTLADSLRVDLDERCSIYNLDNHQKFEGGLPMVNGMKNWDHPDSINWNAFTSNLQDLRAGKPVIVEARDQQTLKVEESTRLVFDPTEIVIVEGYLLFHDVGIRTLLDFKIFLDASDEVRLERRTKFKDPRYTEKILLPMHHQFIEPTKQYADLVLDTEQLSLEECRVQILEKLKQFSL